MTTTQPKNLDLTSNEVKVLTSEHREDQSTELPSAPLLPCPPAPLPPCPPAPLLPCPPAQKVTRSECSEIEAKIRSKEARIAIIGLGYVGLPLATELALNGFTVTGIDVDDQKVQGINNGHSYIEDINSAILHGVVGKKLLTATIDHSTLSEADVTIICVPTPLRKTKDPDLSYIISAVENVTQHGGSGQLIVLESTTYPGTCEELIMPMLENAGKKVGADVFLAFSPERIDPGNKKYFTRNIPKVVGGITPQCTRLAALLYGQIVDQIIPVSSTKAAEMVKLLENSFRSINIALINEFAIICSKMGIDVWEVIDAAATKPFGFTPFYPGPGLGGHCLPIDPIYLSWKAKLLDIEAKFIDLAAKVNASMPDYVITRVAQALNEQKKCVNGSRILILGVSYKKDVSDIRESPALDVMKHLSEMGASLSYSDIHVPDFHFNGQKISSVDLSEDALISADCVVILTDHSDFDYERIVSNAHLIVDTRNATKGLQGDARIVKL